MKRIRLVFLSIILTYLAVLLNNQVIVNALMNDKTEIPVNLEVSGAEAICQTDDGYIWIAQYSGLIRYDSKEFVTYKSFTENGTEHSIANVRSLVNKNNTLFIATPRNLIIHENNLFSKVDYTFSDDIRDVVLDKENDLLYVATYSGAYTYNINDKTVELIASTQDESIADIAVDTKRNNYYYQNDEGLVDKNGTEIISYPKILDIVINDDILYACDDTGKIYRYNMETQSFLDEIIVSDQINKLLYAENAKTLYAACENNGLYCIDLSSDEPSISLIDQLKNKYQLVDLLVDYQDNLWVASHHNGESGVSIITKNSLLELLYDDPVWSAIPELDRVVYAVEKIDNILYIVSGKGIYLYDTNTNQILQDNIIMDSINNYVADKKESGTNVIFSPRDVEKFKDKIYFAVSGIGLIEFNPITNNVAIYDLEYLTVHLDKVINDPVLVDTNNTRALRSFDDFLAIGYSKGLMKFDGTNFSIMNFKGNVLYINKTKDGKIMLDRTSGLFVINDEFTVATEIPTLEDVEGSRLKFLVDGDYIYYNLNGRLYRLEEHNGVYESKEIELSYVRGSIVELSKIKYKNENNETEYRYVIASENQIYITNSLEVDKLTDYEFYDKTNGLQAIKANTSGYYDEEEQLYYFQTSDGVFVYNFNEKHDVAAPTKMAISSIDLDGKEFYGDSINIGKGVYRVSFNLSILGFRPSKGYRVYYKLDGIDNEFHETSDENRAVYYTNIPGGSYKFRVYSIDEYGQKTNEVVVTLVKDRKIHEHIWFWIVVAVLSLGLIILITFFIIHRKTQQSIRKQLEYKNITVESIQAIARTIDAKDEYTNGHSIRVGYYSKLIAQNLGMKEDEVDNIYYIALLHDIGKIAIPDKILNKPGRLTDEEFAVMKSHTTRGAKILEGISTIPQIIEGAKSHHEKWNGAGYPEGLKGEEIPFVARIICCADCFDAMASKRVYKEPFPLDDIINEFKRCSGTQFDPKIAVVVEEMMATGKLKPYSAENTYLGEDGKTHRVSKINKENE